MTKFCIVKFAADPYWKFDWTFNDKDPKLGVSKDASCHDTYVGRAAGIEPRYVTREDAGLHAARLNHLNPSGGYAVCPIVEESTSNDS